MVRNRRKARKILGQFKTLPHVAQRTLVRTVLPLVCDGNLFPRAITRRTIRFVSVLPNDVFLFVSIKATDGWGRQDCTRTRPVSLPGAAACRGGRRLPRSRPHLPRAEERIIGAVALHSSEANFKCSLRGSAAFTTSCVPCGSGVARPVREHRGVPRTFSPSSAQHLGIASAPPMRHCLLRGQFPRLMAEGFLHLSGRL